MPDRDAVDHYSMGANFELVTKSVAHLAKCNAGHVGQHFLLEPATDLDLLQ